MEHYFETPGLGIAPYRPDGHWVIGNRTPHEGATFLVDGRLLIDERAGGYSYWTRFAPKRPRSGVYSLRALRDRTGNLLKGSNLYRLRVPPDVPVRDHWSILVYAKESKAFLHNDLDRIGVSSREGRKLRAGDDGAVDVYFGPEAPPDRSLELGADRRRLLPDPVALRTRESGPRPIVQDARSREAGVMAQRFEVQATAQSHFSWVRTRLSVERTLMSWVRTATALIGFGFTIVTFFDQLKKMGGEVHRTALLQVHLSRYLGQGLILAGILALIVAAWQYESDGPLPLERRVHADQGVRFDAQADAAPGGCDLPCRHRSLRLGRRERADPLKRLSRGSIRPKSHSEGVRGRLVSDGAPHILSPSDPHFVLSTDRQRSRS